MIFLNISNNVIYTQQSLWSVTMRSYYVRPITTPRNAKNVSNPPLTFALWFEIAMDWRGRGFYFGSTCRVEGVPPQRRCGRSDGSQRRVTEAHVGRWWDLPPEGSVLACHWEGRHGDVVGILDRRLSGSGRRHPGTWQEFFFC